jgi:hypothetical protein
MDEEWARIRPEIRNLYCISALENSIVCTNERLLILYIRVSGAVTAISQTRRFRKDLGLV